MAPLLGMLDKALLHSKHCETTATSRAVWLIPPTSKKERSGMGLRWLFVVAVVVGFSPAEAFASEGIFHRASCSVVRYYVAKYSAPAAEAWARSKGASEAEIEAARRCLNGAPTRTIRTAQDMN
jgi:hypothetical protein